MNHISANMVIFLTGVLGLAASTYASDVSVIINPTKDTELTKTDVAQIFLGKASQFPNGEPARPVHVELPDETTKIFTRKVLRKTPSQLRAYWAIQVFTGRKAPPIKVINSAKAKELVSNDKRYISYINKKDIDDTVAVALSVKE